VELFASITQPASAKGVAGSDPQATPGSTGVTYRVQVARAAVHQPIEQLPLAETHRVRAPLRKPFESYWRARRGEYRVQYVIDGTTHTVQVLEVSHRWDAYR